MEHYVVAGLVDFDDLLRHDADLLNDFAAQTLNHFSTYQPEEGIWHVLHHHQKDMANAIHSQMHKQFGEEVAG